MQVNVSNDKLSILQSLPIIRGGFTVKLQRQGPSLAWAPSKALGGALVMCSHGHTFFLICNIKSFNHNQLNIVEVCQAVNYYNFLHFVMFVVFVSFF